VGGANPFGAYVMTNIVRPQLPVALESALSARNIPGIDALRAISVLLVMVYHFGYSSVPGGYGVVFFFVLSGFLITWLLQQELHRSQTISFSKFYARRSLRIFPAFYAYWIVSVLLLTITEKHINWPHALSAAFYYSNYYHAILQDPNDLFSHTWSLAIEEQFYILWPLTLLYLKRRGARLDICLAVAIFAIAAYRAALVNLFHVDQAWLYAAFDTRADALLVGCLTAVILFERRLASFWHFLSSSTLAPVITIALIWIAMGHTGMTINRYRDVYGFALVPPLMAIFMVQCIMFTRSNKLWNWLEWRSVKYVGRISYGLYLYQQLTVDYVHRHMGGPDLLKLTAAIAATLVCASLSFSIIERPFLRAKERFSEPVGKSAFCGAGQHHPDC
jgi:peptidoglycan/LPS O-acetylase OafA/YrhL